jgi:biotin carboxylase/2-polyprenyl-3-methyl-5-hydroxy-6-metoxy-1,4-benzoquinol methylase
VNILSIGAGKEQLKSIKIAQEMGFKVVACDGNPNAEGFECASYPHHIDIKDEQKVIDLAKKYDIKFILPAPIGRYLTTVGAVNDALNLKGITKKSAEICTDKYLFHQKLSDSINLAKQFLVFNVGDIEKLIKEKKIATPFILKPRFGSGSKGVKVFEAFDHEEVKNFFVENSSFKDILIEELLEGDEIGVDAIIRDKKLEIIALRDKKITPLPYRQELAYIFPSKYKTEEIEIKKLIEKSCVLLGINDALLHADIMIHNDSIYIIELSPRASGNNISHIFLPLAKNIDPISTMINYYQGIYEKIEDTQTPLYLEFFHFSHNDIGKKIIKIDEFKNIKNLYTYKLGLKENELIKHIKSGEDAMKNGYFILKGEKDMQILEKQREDIYKHIQIADFDKSNNEGWSKEIKKNVMLYPDTYIVSFIAKNFPDKEQNKKLKALDIGFGSGRNMKLFKDYNFQTYGIDYSQEACDAAKELFNLSNKEISCIDLKEKPFGNEQFDVILSYGVIFFRDINNIKNDLRILYTNLKSSGKMMVNFRTKDDFLYKQGEMIDKHTFILNHPNYNNMCYTFLDLDEVKTLLIETGFNIDNISRVDYHKNNLTEHHSWWIAEVTKK